MEMEGDEREYEFISGNTRQPWCTRRRKIVFTVLTITCIIIIVVAIVATTKSSSPKELPPIKWDGNCPLSAPACPAGYQDPPLLLISLDSFRPDYLEGQSCPTLSRLSKCGASAEYMTSVYPTKTFPNHYSQVTGLFPAWHGIIDNYMYDPGTNKTFKPGTNVSMESFWWQAEPIWVTAEKQGKKSATFFWPGADVEINGTRPTYYRKYNTSIPFETRVDQVLRWLELPARDRPALITLYFNEPDTAAHEYGTEASQTAAAVTRVDSMIERLYSGLQIRNLTNCVNVFIMSDHGMANNGCNHSLNLDDFIDTSNVRAVVGTFGRLQVKRDSYASEQDILDSLRCREAGMRVYRKMDLPVRDHYVQNSRIEPIILDIDSGWTLRQNDAKWLDCSGAAHGYDNLYHDMRSTFISLGPSLKRNTTVSPFMNIELYELMSELIGIVPNPNNGTRGSLHHLLKNPPAIKKVEATAPYQTATVFNNGDSNVTDCPCERPVLVSPPEETDELLKFYLPFGLPLLPQGSTDYRLLNHSDFVVAFDTKNRMPLWAAYTLETDSTFEEAVNICWSGDNRLRPNESSKCSDYEGKSEVLQRPLYPPGFSNILSQDEAMFVSNSVPKGLKHTANLESEMSRMLQKWTQDGSPVNVITGPATYPPWQQVVVPSHYFVIATSCSDRVGQLSDCDSHRLLARTFLLPNIPYPDNCEAPNSVILRNSARVADVEFLTGMRFFPSLSPAEGATLRAAPPPGWQR